MYLYRVECTRRNQMSLFREALASQQNWCPTQYSAFGMLAIAPIILQGNKTGCHVYRTIYLAEQILEIIFRIGYIEPYCNNFHIQHAQPPDLSCRLYVRHGTNSLVTGK